MSDGQNTPATPGGEPGIMGSLPKRRPQRPSARRASAQEAPPKRAPTKPRAASKQGATPKPRPTPKAEPARAPRQGFEAESDVETGKSVQPPGGIELAASVVEIFGELAQTGLTNGGRLLKDVLTRLSPS
jgi:hypothetical protein